MEIQDTPKTLQEAIVFFSNPKNCLQYMIARRWPNGVICPTCGRNDARFLERQNKWQCKSVHQRRQFSMKTGTIFEDSPLGLDKWLTAVWMLTNCKNGVSSYEIHRAIGVTQKSAWFMLQRIRLAMQTESYSTQLSGHVEVDETYIGGLARNLHRDVRERRNVGTGGKGKIAVMGLLERHGEFRAHVIKSADRETLHSHIKSHVESGSNVYTDGWPAYGKMDSAYTHGVIDHAEKYVDGLISTNGCENFWSLLKRMLRGTYISVEPFHLFRYLDEQSFRFNKRKGTDADRFKAVTKQVTGKRLTFKEVTGKLTDDDKLSC
jgi:transposase-like protein